MAQLPSVGHEQFYSILAANDDLVFMHVDEPGGERHRVTGDASEGWGTTGTVSAAPSAGLGWALEEKGFCVKKDTELLGAGPEEATGMITES